MIAQNRLSHSAVVRASLRVGERVFNVAQVGNGYCILRNAELVEPSDAELEVSVDGVVDRWPVHLGRGIDPQRSRTEYHRVS